LLCLLCPPPDGVGGGGDGSGADGVGSDGDTADATDADVNLDAAAIAAVDADVPLLSCRTCSPFTTIFVFVFASTFTRIGTSSGCQLLDLSTIVCN
jgi:hypothetical protein